jgi:hypothetical protein
VAGFAATLLKSVVPMTVLDCESYESALCSICSAYKIDRARLVDFLITTDLDEEYKRASHQSVFGETLTNLFESQFGKPPTAFDSVAWFHLTRVPEGTTFSDGILPLNLALPKVWQAVVSSVSDTQRRERLEELHSEGVPDFQYNFKTNDKLHFGPHAMLVRESAFHAESMGNHDYLRLPEIVEDVCNGYETRYGESICAEISQALRKCIVKFVISDNAAGAYTEEALKYCWCKANEQPLDTSANSCYDAEGKTIPPEAIQEVQFL